MTSILGKRKFPSITGDDPNAGGVTMDQVDAAIEAAIISAGTVTTTTVNNIITSRYTSDNIATIPAVNNILTSGSYQTASDVTSYISGVIANYSTTTQMNNTIASTVSSSVSTATANMVTTNTTQTISGHKAFTGSIELGNGNVTGQNRIQFYTNGAFSSYIDGCAGSTFLGQNIQGQGYYAYESHMWGTRMGANMWMFYNGGAAQNYFVFDKSSFLNSGGMTFDTENFSIRGNCRMSDYLLLTKSANQLMFNPTPSTTTGQTILNVAAPSAARVLSVASTVPTGNIVVDSAPSVTFTGSTILTAPQIGTGFVGTPADGNMRYTSSTLSIYKTGAAQWKNIIDVDSLASTLNNYYTSSSGGALATRVTNIETILGTGGSSPNIETRVTNVETLANSNQSMTTIQAGLIANNFTAIGNNSSKISNLSQRNWIYKNLTVNPTAQLVIKSCVVRISTTSAQTVGWVLLYPFDHTEVDSSDVHFGSFYADMSSGIDDVSSGAIPGSTSDKVTFELDYTSSPFATGFANPVATVSVIEQFGTPVKGNLELSFGGYSPRSWVWCCGPNGSSTSCTFTAMNGSGFPLWSDMRTAGGYMDLYIEIKGYV